MTEERTWYLLSLSLAGEATAEEAEELQALLQLHPDLGLRAEILQNIWKSKQSDTTAIAGNFDRHLQRLTTHLSEPVLQFENPEANLLPLKTTRPGMFGRKYRWLWATAGMAASILIAAVFLFPVSHRHIASNTVSTRAGSKSKIQLPDGTQVWLNADSKIKYDQSFMGAFREVQLTGEAYFDVVKDKSRPFIIHTSSIDVRVVGTSFNVRSYPNEKTTETALIQGTVEITLHNNPDKKIILKPSEKCTVVNPLPPAPDQHAVAEEQPMLTIGRIRYGKTDSTSSIETMWVKNKLAFENESFERITSEMERWYNVKFDIKRESLKEEHLTGIFENKSLTEVMEALRFSGGFKYTVKEGIVSVW